MRLCRPRQWGACWLALSLWEELRLDRFWSERLPASRKGTRWDLELFVLVAYRLLAPGSEWRLHREWFERTALADLMGGDFGLAEIHKLYRCHDRLLEHKEALFDHLTERWRDLFAARFDLLLYDLTSTYFEAEPPFAEGDKRRYGYSRDHRPDCVQGVIALVVTPEGLPLAYEVLSGRVEEGRGGLSHWQWLRFPSPLISRVEDWRAGLGRSSCSLLARSFVCECHTISTMPRFQPPPRRTQHADFLALRSPACFAPRLMEPILPERLSGLAALDSR